MARETNPFELWTVVPWYRRLAASVKHYTVTLANAEASGDNTIATITIPGSLWQDGWVVGVRIFAVRKNDSGGNRATLLKVNATGASAQQLGSVTWVAGTTERKSGSLLQFFRSGTKIFVPVRWGDDGALSLKAEELIKDTQADGFGGSVTGGGYVELTPIDFTANVVLTVIVNLATTHASYYLRPSYGVACLSPVPVL